MADVTSPFGFPYPEDTDLVRDGATDIENLATGVNDYLTGGFLYAGTRYYENSGTFAKADPLGTGDIGLRAIRVRMVGGGGASGGTLATAAGENAAGAGGGGGGYAEVFLTDMSALSSSETVTRGAGGTAATGATGGAGGTSSFGTFCVAAGGGGGVVGANTSTVTLSNGGSGGTGTTGDLLIEGSDGGNSLVTDDLARSFTIAARLASEGGGSVLSGRQRVDAGGATRAGLAGKLYGGGASGTRTSAVVAAQDGAAGANGIVIVDCFV
jgi:hypothetical protein